MEKTYVIKIEAEGLRHHQVICDKEDLEILKSVLKKIEKDAEKAVYTNTQKDN